MTTTACPAPSGHSAPYRYVWPSKLDLMAKITDLRVRDRRRAGTGRHSPPTATARSRYPRNWRNRLPAQIYQICLSELISARILRAVQNGSVCLPLPLIGHAPVADRHLRLRHAAGSYRVRAAPARRLRRMEAGPALSLRGLRLICIPLGRAG